MIERLSALACSKRSQQIEPGGLGVVVGSAGGRIGVAARDGAHQSAVLGHYLVQAPGSETNCAPEGIDQTQA